jgi:hypothetical protein
MKPHTLNLKKNPDKKMEHAPSFRAHHTHSPDGKLLLIDAGIIASSARQLVVVNVENEPNVVYREEIWYDPPSEYECSFNDMSQFVVK